MKIRYLALFVGINLFWLVIFSLFLPTGKFSNENKTVYTTETGKCYHLSSCSSLSYSKYKTTIKEAHNDGYYACSRCDAPALIKGDGFDFSPVHYLILVPFCALLSHIGMMEALDLSLKRPIFLYFLHLIFSAGISALFELLV